MEIPETEDSGNSVTSPPNESTDHRNDAAPAPAPAPAPDASDHDGAGPKPEFSQEEVRGILETIASTGKFWHDWEKLKSMLSFQLKQVLSEYPEAKRVIEEQIASLGETYPELVKRLDEAIENFDEGPPFTLQRLCEILLAARSIYPNLSKLALALEKNLLVTSTLTICTDPYPTRETEPEIENEVPQAQPDIVENGDEPMAGDKDEVMTEVEEEVHEDDMTIDMEAFEDIVRSSETSSTPNESS